MGGGVQADSRCCRMSEFNFILDGMTWSFSRVTAYEQCPKQFKLVYIDCLDKLSGAFAEWGSWCHELLEGFYKGNIPVWDLGAQYIAGYPQHVLCAFPRFNYKVDLDQKYFDRGEEYFQNFEDIFSEYEVVGVEEEISLTINGRDFIGYIDLILKDKQGNYILVDHKSKSSFKNKEEKEKYLTQLYLYSEYIKQRFGVYPKWLIFNMFRSGKIVRERFSIEKNRLAVKWLTDTIDKIYCDREFQAKPERFFCDYLCDVREHCAYSNDYDGGGG